MRRLANAFWPAVLVTSFLATGCATAGQAAPSGSRSPATVASVAALAGSTPNAPAASTPTAQPTTQPVTSAGPKPMLAPADLPKEGQKAGPDEFAAYAFKEVGLPGGQPVSYELTGDGSASYQCWNPTTKAFGKENWTVTDRLTTKAIVTAGADGMIASVLQLRLPEPSKMDCSTGFRAVAYAGKVDHPQLTDTTNTLTVELEPYQFTAN